jgi:nucleotide-binding universal stress UspA family protein
MSSTSDVIIAAVDGGPDSPQVLQIATQLAEATRSAAEAVHVSEGSAASARAAAEGAGVPIRVLEGAVEPVLLAAVESQGTLLSVVGGHHRDREHPVGHVARYILEHTTKPVVVAPSQAVLHQRLTSVLVPLEGTEGSSQPIIDLLLPLLGSESEFVVLHVFTEETQPRMLDRPQRDLELVGSEFLSQHIPHLERIELRSGPVALSVADVAEKVEAGMIALSWSQDSSPGRARVVRDVIRSTHLPVLLLPALPGRTSQ